MKYLLVLAAFFWNSLGIDSNSISTRRIPVNQLNDWRTFTLNGVINPYVIATIVSLQSNDNYEISTDVYIQGHTKVIFRAIITEVYIINTYLVFQIMLLTKLPFYQVSGNLNFTNDNLQINYTSTKGLKYTEEGEGNLKAYCFLTGLSTFIVLDTNTFQTTMYQDSDVFTIWINALLPKQVADMWWIKHIWVTVNVLIMGQSLTPKCSSSVYEALDDLSEGTYFLQKKENFDYFFGLTKINDYSVGMRTFPQTNTIIITMGMFSYGFLAIDTLCLNQVVDETYPKSFFEKWKIAIIVVCSSLGMIIIIAVILLMKYFKNKKTSSELQDSTQKIKDANQAAQTEGVFVNAMQIQCIDRL